MFVHLHVHSPFSFLDGASGIEDLVAAAAGFGMPALALTDHDGVGGAVRFHRACAAAGIKPVQWAEVTLEGGFHLVLLADGPEGYANLCRLLTSAHLENPRGEPRVSPASLAAHAGSLYALSGCRRGEIPALLLARRHREAEQAARRYRRVFGRRFFLELIQDFLPGNRALNRLLVELAARLGLETVATNNVHYAALAGFPAHDLLTCVRTGTVLEAVHPERRLNAENHLKPPEAMAALFRSQPRAVANTLELAASCRPALELGVRRGPRFPVPQGETAAGMLRALVRSGAARRYGPPTPAVTARLEHELDAITRLGYEDYFLVAWDAVRYAAGKGIRFAGRGSAGDSAVASLPRFIGTHLGGLVISGGPLTAVTPLQRAAKGVTVAQFDKDDVEALGLLKFDLLSLRTLSAVEDTVAAVRRKEPGFDYGRIPKDDPETFAMFGRGETVGVFQLESPAQRALQPRLRAREMEDVVASVALIRPGPIQGDMVEPYIARRLATEPVSYLDPRLEPILKKTYGVVLFQEQVLAIATAVAGFTPGEADRLRRAISKHRSRREMEAIGEEFTGKAVAAGVEEGTAREIFDCLRGYAGYGFCEAHAAAFGLTAYRTGYLARHYPAEYFAALLLNQPMGYYSPQTLCTVARGHGVGILPPDVNRSGTRFTVEHGSIRVPLTQVRGTSVRDAGAVLTARSERPFQTADDFFSRAAAGVDGDVLVNLILCGALDNLEPNRRALLARFRSRLRDTGGGLLREEEPAAEWPDFTAAEKRCYEHTLLGLDVGPHPLAGLRDALNARGYLSSVAVRDQPEGAAVRLAGFPVRPHRPPTRSGQVVVFFSVEDEFGLADVTVFEDCYRESGWILFTASGPVEVAGRVHRRDGAVSVLARRINFWEGA